MKKEEKGTRCRHGTVNFEKRRHPGFNVDLPREYTRSDLGFNHGGVFNAGEGGLLLHLPEEMEVGQHLSLKLFFPSRFELNAMGTLV